MTEAIAENKQQLAERVEEIRSNRDLSDSAKQRMIGEAYDEASSRHGEPVAEREEAAAREVVQRERAVFGLAYPKDAVTNRDKEAFRQSYRDAAFRVFNMEPENLERVLDRAERIGDEQLSLAVYHEAVEREISPLANRYREERPDAKRRWDEYVSARQAGESTEGLLFSGYSSVGPEMPPEVGGMGGAMPRRCAICSHADKEAIDEALVGGTALSALAVIYRVSDDSLGRHKANHLPAKLVLAQAAEEVAEADELLDQVRGLQARTLAILEAAEETRQHRTALSAIREARSNLELLAKLLGELDERPQVNILISPEWLELRTVIVGALEPYSEARGAVLAAIEGAGNGRA